MTLEQIIDAHKATFSIRLLPAPIHADYFANISFGEGKIEIEILDGESAHYQDGGEPMQYEWIEQITKLVNDLKEAKIIPHYTLALTPEE